MDRILQNAQYHMPRSARSYVLYKSEKNHSALYSDKIQVLKDPSNCRSAIFSLIKLGRTTASSS